MRIRLLLLFLLSVAIAGAAPVNLQELQFLVRQRTPEVEIMQEVARRRLLVPIDAAAELALREVGASDALIAALRRPEYALSPVDARAEIERQRAHQMRTAQSAAEDAAAHARMQQRQQQVVTGLQRAGATRQMLDGLLVKLDGDQLKPFDARELENVRVFAFYYSAMWCGPCRKFMPQLLEYYQRLKAQYPGKFELVFISSDNDEYNMAEYMRTYRMPWPAVKFGAASEQINQFGGKSIPWLVAVSDSAQPLTKNAVDKKYIAPAAILGGIEELLAKVR